MLAVGSVSIHLPVPVLAVPALVVESVVVLAVVPVPLAGRGLSLESPVRVPLQHGRLHQQRGGQCLIPR